MDDQTPETTDQLQEAAAPDAAETSAPDPFESGADSFDRAYVERLRKESASYRTKAKDYEGYAKAFESYSEDDRAVWQEAMRIMNEDSKQGAEYLRQIADALLAEEKAAEAPAADDSEVPAWYKAAKAAEAAAAKEAAEVARVESEAKELGYDPASLDYRLLLQVALETTKGDMQAAHKVLKDREQAAVDRYLAAKAKDAEEAPAAPADAGYAPSGERPLRTWADADAAFRARLEAARHRS